MFFRRGGYGRGSNAYQSRNNDVQIQQGQAARYNNSDVVSTGTPTPRAFNSPAQKNSQLYMGDLDPFWDENTVRQIWASLGEASVDIKIMWNNDNGGMHKMGQKKNLGYCFVEFPSYSHASNALLKNGIAIPGFPSRSLKLNWALSSSASSGPFSASAQEMSVFVGDLAPNVTESELFELFISRFPSTAHAKVVYDQMTGVSRGYAFIRFGNSVDQKRALTEMQGVFLNGRAIRVSSAGNQHQQNNSVRADNRMKSNFNNHAKNNKSNKIPITSSQFMFPVQQEPPLTSFTDSNSTTVFIGGLSSAVRESHLWLYFQPFGQIVYVKIPVGKGCGFVQYVDRISAELAITKMQGFPIGDSRIRMSWGRSAKQAATLEKVEFSNQIQTQLHQPLQQPTYAYTPSTNFYQTNCLQLSSQPSSEPNSDDPSLLLPGYQNLTFSAFPKSSSGLQLSYLYPSYGSDSSPQANSHLLGADVAETITMPHILVDDEIAFVRGKSDSLNRLENGSNGFVLA